MFGYPEVKVLAISDVVMGLGVGEYVEDEDI